jgi:hypothetical protein
MSPERVPGPIVPLSFDLGGLVRRSVASLYSHLITRPTGQALRLGIESQIGEMGELCLSVLDFTQVTVLDYSCADEAVAKLILRYRRADRPADAYFVVQGVDEHHRETIEEVLERHNLAVVAELAGAGPTLLGEVSPLERAVWLDIVAAGSARVAEVASRLAAPLIEVDAALQGLAAHRVLIWRPASETYHAIHGLLGRT